MKVEQHLHTDIFPDFNFDNLENFANALIKEDKVIQEINRGTKKSNTYKDCKEHNMAVNAKYNVLYRKGEFYSMLVELQTALKKYYPDCTNEIRNTIFYKKHDFMGWHTNKYQTGQRVYLIWSDEDKKSSFDYYEKGKKKSILAPKGFSVNTFYCGNFERMLTHQVTSDCNRMSIGFRLR